MIDLDMSKRFAVARREDHGNHTPTDDDWWQESAFFNMCDPVTGVMGYYRIGMHPNLGVANSYYWTAAAALGLDDKNFRHGMPLPTTDVNNTTVGDLTFETIRPMEEYRVAVDKPGYRMEVTWKPFFHPIMFHTEVTGAGFATGGGHYNALGQATGFIEVDGKRQDVNAYGYMDHSWGVRKHHFPGSKWILSIAEPGDFVHVFVVADAAGTSAHAIGYACRDGKLRRLVDDFETGFTMRDDWLTVAKCDARFVDEDGRTFQVKGQTMGSECAFPYLHGFACVHALAGSDLDGRPAKGLLENTNPIAPPPAYVERFGIEQRSMWMKPPGEIVAGPGSDSKPL